MGMGVTTLLSDVYEAYGYGVMLGIHGYGMGWVGGIIGGMGRSMLVYDGSVHILMR